MEAKMQGKSAYREGTGFVAGYRIVLVIAGLLALVMSTMTEGLLEWAGVVEEVKKGAEAGTVQLSKLGKQLVMPLAVTFLMSGLAWILEAVHVHFSLKTRLSLSEAEEKGTGIERGDMEKGSFFLSFYQFFLVLCVLGGFIGMMFVPGILKGGGVKAPAVAATTLIAWIAYLGPVLFCAFRFHHAGITRDTRLKLAALAAESSADASAASAPMTEATESA
jgi:hypothetical protein